MQYYVYVLKSEKNGRSYIGHTQDVVKRLKEHNSDQSQSTRYNGPWKLVYNEAFLTRAEAMKRERYFKTVAGRIELKRMKIF